MIISLSGRKNAGKTTLALVAKKNGWTMISFQSFFDKKAEALIRGKNTPIKHLDREFSSKEELSIFLREIAFKNGEQDHLRAIGKMINLSNRDNIVIDDVRTVQEKEFLEGFGDVIFFFVSRLHPFETDNSDFECSLRTCHFDDFIFNREKNYPKKLINRFSNFTKRMARNALPFNSLHRFESKFKAREALKAFFKHGQDTDDEFFSKFTKQQINRCYGFFWLDKRRQKHNIDTYAFSHFDEETAYFAGLFCADGCLKSNSTGNGFSAKFSSSDMELIEKFQAFLKTDYPLGIDPPEKSNHKILYNILMQSPSIVENLKLWNIKPRKSTKEEVPFPILGNEKLIKAWTVGMIDGDGHICLRKNSIIMGLVCSDQVADYLNEIVPNEIRRSVVRIKTINGLSMSRFIVLGHMAVDFYNWLDKPQFGLKRKWGNIEKFSSLKSQRKTKRTIYSST